MKMEMLQKIFTVWLVLLLACSLTPVVFMAQAATNQLSLSAPSSVVEGNSFQVIVRDANSSYIPNATVLFNDYTYYTGQNGKVNLTAPQVDFNTNYSLIAKKTGYLDGSAFILVLDSTPRLVIDAPSSVVEEEEFSVHVTDVNGTPIDDAEVDFIVPGNNQTSYTLNGTAWFTAPVIDETLVGGIDAFKTGYSSDHVTITIVDQGTYLVINAPSYVSEGEEFSVYVTDGEGTPIDDAEVWLIGSGYNQSVFTIDGIAWLTAPLVDEILVTWIDASKTGYSSAQEEITILDQGYQPNQLVINAPSSVTEGGSLFVTVTVNTTPIHGVEVTFAGDTLSTNATGVVVFTAPLVGHDTYYVIQASLDGYLNDSASILVRNTESPPPPSSPPLQIDAPSSAIEGNSFEITVTSQGNPVSSATVTFNGNSYYTDTDGTLTLLAPSVNKDTGYLITATKVSYQSAIKSITIGNRLSNQSGGSNEGRVYGRVTDSQKLPLSGAEVCILLSGDNRTMKICVLTTENGIYDISIAAGTYDMKASKEGYMDSIIENVTVVKNVAYEINFTLPIGTEVKSQQSLVDIAIKQMIEQGLSSGIIYLRSPSLQEEVLTEVTTYNSPLSIRVESATQNNLIFVVSGPEGAVGTIITVRFGPGTLEDMKNVTVIYDNESIHWVNFEEIFLARNETNTTAHWTSVLAIDGEGNEILYCLIWIPHFSEHTITIQALAAAVEAVGGVFAMVVFIAVFCILGVVYFIPYFLVRKSR